MTTLLVLGVLTVLLMIWQDSCGSGMVVAEGRNLKRWPGLFDALNDFASRYGAGITAASVVKWGLGSWQTFVLVCLTATTSYFTTNETTALAHQLLPKGAA